MKMRKRKKIKNMFLCLIISILIILIMFLTGIFDMILDYIEIFGSLIVGAFFGAKTLFPEK